MRRRSPYDRDYPAEPIPSPWGGYYPPASWGGGMFYSLEGCGAPAPFAPAGYERYDFDFRNYLPYLRPDESTTYGRGGDRALRRWARARGFALRFVTAPRRDHRRSRRSRGPSDRPRRG